MSAKEKKRVISLLSEIDKKLGTIAIESNKALESALQQHLNDREAILKRRCEQKGALCLNGLAPHGHGVMA